MPNQAKHTPGPWKARCCDRSSTWDVVSDDYGSIVTVHDYPHNAWRLEPDARLIAAAPELLAACQAIISCAGEGSRSLETARKLARAAVAKAEAR